MLSTCTSKILLMGALAIALAVPAGAQSSASVVRLGTVLDQSTAGTSPHFRKAVELAARQMNEALAKAGSRLKFEFVFGDSRSNSPFALSEAQRLINQEGVKGLVTDSSGVTVAINRVNYDLANSVKSRVPITCYQCSSSFINNPTVTESDPNVQASERDLDNWLFRVFYVAKYEAAALAQITLNKVNKEGSPLKVSVFTDSVHRAVATDFARVLPTLHKGPTSVELIYMSTIDKLADDWRKVLDDKDETSGKVDGPPDVVLVAQLPEAAAEAIKIYRQAGYKTPILSNNSFRRNYILKGIGAPANGLEGASVTQVDKSRSGQAYLKAFAAAFGDTPEVTSSGAYDCAVTLMLAAVAASENGAKEVTAAGIRSGLTTINNPKGQKIRPTIADFSAAARAAAKGKPINYEGAYHPIDWDAVGDMFPPMVHWKVENGKFVEYELYLPGPNNSMRPVR